MWGEPPFALRLTFFFSFFFLFSAAAAAAAALFRVLDRSGSRSSGADGWSSKG